MSWSFPPRGIVLAEQHATDDHTDDYPLSEVTYNCPDFFGGTVECHRADDFDGSVTAPIAEAAAAFTGSYPWYSVTVQFIFPPVPPGRVGCQSFGIYSGCDTDHLEGGSATISFADGHLCVLPGDGSHMPTTASTPPATSAQLKLGDISFGLLLNPSPTFPVPDADGNTAGSVLFTAAELAALSVQFDWVASIGFQTLISGGGPGPGQLRWEAGVAGYNEVEQTSPPQMFVVDPTGTD